MEMLDDLIFELKAASSNASSEKGNKDAQTAKVEKPKKEAKAPREKKVQGPAPSKDDLNLNSLDLRVGKIVSVRKHDTADKLYCEEIDIGEESGPRAIASGLVPHYTLEEMQDKRVIVVANLKPRSLVGFKSCGMVLCAAKDDGNGGEKVEFLDPPANAPLGARITAEGLTNEPLSQKQCDKQKAFEFCAADLTTDGAGVGYWRDFKLVCEGQACVAPTVFEGKVR